MAMVIGEHIRLTIEGSWVQISLSLMDN